MKKLTLQLLLVILSTCFAIFTKPQSASAQVNMSLLAEVAKSCQKDAISLEYYKQMGFDDDKLELINDPDMSLNLTDDCIFNRYYHSLVQSKFPWLASTGEIIPGFPGSVTVSLIAFNGFRSSLLDCIASQDPSSQVCSNVNNTTFNPTTRNSLGNEKIVNIRVDNYARDHQRGAYIYTCPSCVIVHDNVLSSEKMMGGFIQWFLRLEKPRRRKIMSILGNGQEPINNRDKISEEARRAVVEYKETREKVKQQEVNRRRREVLGN